tara:strand:+ start:403 stop:672 length:270 start_codon:yes stop_codon:yes gene_type:complete
MKEQVVAVALVDRAPQAALATQVEVVLVNQIVTAMELLHTMQVAVVVKVLPVEMVAEVVLVILAQHIQVAAVVDNHQALVELVATVALV